MAKKPGTALTIPTAAALALPSNEAIKEISALAARQVQLEDRIAKGMALLEDLGKQLKQVNSVDLPTAMQAAGVKSIGLPDGSKVEVNDFVAAQIKEENRPKAHTWLRKNKLGSLVKTTVDIVFGMGEEKKAAAFMKSLNTKGIPFKAKEAVHPQTLGALVRERLGAGKALPPQIEYTSVPTSKIIRSKPNDQ